MNKQITVLLLLFLGMARIANAYENTYAIIIGIADYKDTDIQNLKYAVSDALSFCEFLKSDKGGAVPAENICLLTDSMASKENIISQATALFAKVKENDRAIFYFSGHGGKGFFSTYNAGDIGTTLLYFNEVKSIFRCAHCNTKLLFADACFSGSLMGTEVKKPNYVKNSDKESNDSEVNVALMLSSKGNEVSREVSSLGNGLFTCYLIEGLEGKSNSDNNKYVTIAELFNYVHEKVKTKSQGKQTPILFGNFAENLVVAEL